MTALLCPFCVMVLQRRGVGGSACRCKKVTRLSCIFSDAHSVANHARKRGPGPRLAAEVWYEMMEHRLAPLVQSTLLRVLGQCAITTWIMRCMRLLECRPFSISSSVSSNGNAPAIMAYSITPHDQMSAFCISGTSQLIQCARQKGKCCLTMLWRSSRTASRRTARCLLLHRWHSTNLDWQSMQKARARWGTLAKMAASTYAVHPQHVYTHATQNSGCTQKGSTGRVGLRLGIVCIHHSLCTTRHPLSAAAPPPK